MGEFVDSSGGRGRPSASAIQWDGRRTASIAAVEPTITLTLGFAHVERLCERHPEVNRLLVRLLAARVARLTESLMEALHTLAELRLVRSLLALCGVYSSPAQGNSPITVAINQTGLPELAESRDRRRTASAGDSRPAGPSTSIADGSRCGTSTPCTTPPRTPLSIGQRGTT